MNRKVFYDFIRNLPFGGKISPDQFQGVEKILDYQKTNYPDMDKRWLAYILATVFHETARTMQPIEEKGGDKYLRSKKYYPWYGRGLIQITWEDNYRKYGITDPKQALEWDTALYVLFHGMIAGEFRKDKVGKISLARYFNNRVDNPIQARLIVNGIPKGSSEPDKATLIASYHKNFLDALNQAEKAVEAPQEVRAPAPQADTPDAPKLSQDPLTQVVSGIGGVGTLGTLLSAVQNPWAFGVVALIAVGLGLFFILRKRQANATGV